VGEGGGGIHGATAQEEEGALGRRGEGGRRPGGVKGGTGQRVAGPTRPKFEGKFFQNKNWIFEYTKALKVCTRRFRWYFDMGIFPKFF
jgi:hypothetical protein